MSRPPARSNSGLRACRDPPVSNRGTSGYRGIRRVIDAVAREYLARVRMIDSDSWSSVGSSSV